VKKVARKGMDAKIAYDVLVSNSHVIAVDEVLRFKRGLLTVKCEKP
jgi:hypothetical protein